jgi:hypothetical protein
MLTMSSAFHTHLLILTTLLYSRSKSVSCPVFLSRRSLLLMALSSSMSIPVLGMPLSSTPTLLSVTASLLLLSSLPLRLRKIFPPSVLMIPGRSPTSCSSMHAPILKLTRNLPVLQIGETKSIQKLIPLMQLRTPTVLKLLKNI